jgi:hypothetical protein
MGLAKKLYEKPQLLRWARMIVKTYPKKPTKASVRFTLLKEEVEEQINAIG